MVTVNLQGDYSEKLGNLEISRLGNLEIKNVGKGLAAEFASCAFVEQSAETLLDKVVKPVAQRLQFHAVDDFAHEGDLEQCLRFLDGDAPLAHIEQGGIVQLSDGAAVGAFHIVGIDFEHGLGEHVRRSRGAKILVSHL